MGKNKLIFVLLAIFTGWIGLHRLYLGTWFDIVLGIMYVLFWWTGIPLVIALLEALVIAGIKDDKRFKSTVVTQGT